ncbi:MAG: hypothetical protein ACXWUG_25660 [Polyangiales bacterium]
MAWLDEILNFVMHARKPDGDLGECALDAGGNLRVAVAGSGAETTWDDTRAFVSQRVVRTGATQLMHLAGYVEAGHYLLVFDASAVPKDGATPDLPPIPLSVGMWFELPLPPNGRAFKNGVAWAVSSVSGTLVLDPTARVWTSAART